jgi:hypothetical protein
MSTHIYKYIYIYTHMPTHPRVSHMGTGAHHVSAYIHTHKKTYLLSKFAIRLFPSTIALLYSISALFTFARYSL